MTARELRQTRARATIQTPYGGVLYLKHLPRRVKRTVKKSILRGPVRAREGAAVTRYLRREGNRDQSHRFRVPKARWGDGPWQREPDRVDFVHAGLHCVILRNLHVTGSLNGYVGVPPSHPWWGKEEDECLATPRCEPSSEHDATWTGPFARLLAGHVAWYCDHTIQSMIDVHGGINWASPTIGSTKRAHRDLWWFAFDTGHSGDLSPMMEATLRELWLAQDTSGRQWAQHQRVMGEYQTYKDLAYVRHEVESLAAQLAMAGQVVT